MKRDQQKKYIMSYMIKKREKLKERIDIQNNVKKKRIS